MYVNGLMQSGIVCEVTHTEAHSSSLFLLAALDSSIVWILQFTLASSCWWTLGHFQVWGYYE